jgi:hypothetical protein
VIWDILVIFGIALLAASGVFGLEKLVPARKREEQNDVFGFVYAVIGVAYAVLRAQLSLRRTRQDHARGI